MTVCYDQLGTGSGGDDHECGEPGLPFIFIFFSESIFFVYVSLITVRSLYALPMTSKKKKSGLSKLCGRIFHNMCYNRVSELLARDLLGHA